MPDLPASLLAQLRSLHPAPTRLVVAYSGGGDSHVLLHALHAIRESVPAAELRAIHVDHGLQPESAQWARHCQQICSDYAIPLELVQLTLQVPAGISLEAYAREQRYAAIQQRLCAGDVVLLAQHQDDQAETLLLQMLRGGGVSGLAAMPAQREAGGIRYVRPLLAVSKQVMMEYAVANQLDWVEDPSNRNPRFDRNFLRHEVVPVLRSRWPSFAATLERVAQHQAEAQACLQELAAQDLAALGQQQPAQLAISGLQRLSRARQHNVVRYWIAQNHGPLPDSQMLQRIFNELIPASEDAGPVLSWAHIELRRYRDTLYLLPGQAAVTDWQRHWHTDSPLALPGGGYLHAQTRLGTGLSIPDGQAELLVRFRQGGEKCRLPGRSHHHDLKKLMQEWGIPPWQRGAVPLVYVGDQLAQIVGYSLCEPFVAHPDQSGLHITLQN